MYVYIYIYLCKFILGVYKHFDLRSWPEPRIAKDQASAAGPLCRSHSGAVPPSVTKPREPKE